MCIKKKKKSSYECLKDILSLDDKKYVISEQLKSFEDEKEYETFVHDLKYIFIGDNPGEHEHKESVYFSPNGKTGQMLDAFRNDYLKISKREECLYLNKSLIYTKATSNLEDIDMEDDSQLKVVNFINALASEKKEIYIALFGVEYFHFKGANCVDNLFKTFYDNLEYGKVGLFYHISRRYPIPKAMWTQIKKKELVFQEYGKKFLKQSKKVSLLNQVIKKFDKK